MIDGMLPQDVTARATAQNERRNSVRRDLVTIVLVSVAAAIACVRLNLSEMMTGWMREHENLQLDELPGILLVVAACLVWFSLRRYLEASRELALRRVTEARLAEAFAENRRLAQRYLDMQEYERKALARDLHDELGQYINAIKLDAVAIQDGEIPEEARAVVAGMIGNIDRVYAVVGGLIRELRPVGLDDLGVAAALEHCIGDWRQRLDSTDVRLAIDGDLSRLDGVRSLALYRLVQEAMTNVARHSSARHVDIRIAALGGGPAPERIAVTIVDDGRGADLSKPRAGLGLVGMRERTAAFGGTLAIESERGAGFKLAASIPVGADPTPGPDQAP
jgi:two-component system, NarL family, sensor histidine kinase UhpB